MATKTAPSGLIGAIVVWASVMWSACFFLFDLQLSVRVERIDPNTGIIEALKDTASKSFTITDHDYVEEETLFGEISDKE